MTTKICTNCEQEKDLEEFHCDKYGRLGRRSACKECIQKYGKKNRDRLSEYDKIYKNKHKEKIKQQMKEYKIKNKEKIQEYCDLNYEKIKKYKQEYCKINLDKIRKNRKEYLSSSILYSHPSIQQLSIYDEVSCDKDGCVIVYCAYCGKPVNPTVLQVQNRIHACNNLNAGEKRIYCNDNNNACKYACPTFKRRTYPLGFKPATSREVSPLLRQMCFKRDNYTCLHCGMDGKEIQLHCYHINGVKHSPIEQNDIENTLTLCKKCHIELHKQKGCTYQDYKCS